MSFRLTLIIFLFTSGLLSCDAQPEPIRYGTDLCQHCKMTLMDERFGCELLTKKGKVLIYDDVNCLLRCIRSAAIPKKDIKELLVVNFEKKGELLLVDKASFLLADYIISPMGSRVAAFTTKEASIRFRGTRAGQIYTWTELEKTLP